MEFLIVFIALFFSTGFWFWLVRRKDRFAPEPFWFLCKIMLLGGVFSVIPSALLNGMVVDQQTDLLTSLWQNCFVGLNEELWKLVATVYLIKNHHHFDEPVDGIIYAATVALGFAAIENIEYISRYGLNVLAMRHFTSIPGHLAFSMLWGYGLTLAKFKHPEKYWFVVIWPYYLAAALAHGLYNFSQDLFPTGLNIVIAIILVVSLYRYGSKKTTSMLIHSPLRPAGHCPECKTDNKGNSNFCRQCGTVLMLEDEFPLLKKVACQHCSTQNLVSNQFCVECGQRHSA